MITCYGEALVDLIVSPYSSASMQTQAQACLGGSVFNFCLASARQGVSTSYLNALSEDNFGQQFAQLLKDERVSLAQSQACKQPTSIAVIQLDAQGKASYAFHRAHVADTALPAQTVIAAMPQTMQLLHTGCLMLVPTAWGETKKIMASAQSKNSLISVDANLRPSVFGDLDAYRAAVLEACAMADIIKVSDDDLVAMGLLSEACAKDRNAQIAAAQKLLSDRTKVVALTLGAEGACWVDVHTEGKLSVLSCATPAGLTVQDTVGAGDSFMAALLGWLAHQGMLDSQAWAKGVSAVQAEQALKHAVAAAAICVQRVGCNPASWQETLDFVAAQKNTAS